MPVIYGTNYWSRYLVINDVAIGVCRGRLLAAAVALRGGLLATPAALAG